MGNSENDYVSFKREFVAKTNRKDNNAFAKLKQDKFNFSKISSLQS